MKYTKNLICNYKKIVIFGCSGSGKSTLAKQLSKEHNIPAFPLDKIKWSANWQKTSKKDVAKKLDEIISKDSYILEGRYNIKLQEFLDDCDLIIILDTPTYLCLYRSIKRTFISFATGKKGYREDLPKGCNESFGLGYLELLKIILNYKKTKGAEMTIALKDYMHKVKTI